MTLPEAYEGGITKLTALYGQNEASAIMQLVMTAVFKLATWTRSALPSRTVNDEEQIKFNRILDQLEKSMPVQYALEEAWFLDMKFYVDQHVLIPRPETEELVHWVISHVKFPVHQLRILDIGTGSGCIAIALKRKMQKAVVWAIDSSEPALTIAQRNADDLGAAVHFLELDFLQDTNSSLALFDVIISNPPYIPAHERAEMHANVVDFEPAAALFVPDDDPLVFYKAIAKFGKTHLAPSGSIFLEVHEKGAEGVRIVFAAEGYKSIEVKKDMQGKERMLRIVAP